MTDTPDDKFKKERATQAKRLPAIQQDTAREVSRLLDEASKEIQATLASAPSDYQSWSLPNLQKAISQTAAELGTGMAAAGTEAASKAWAAGVELIDKPIAAAIGVQLEAMLPQVDPRQLMAMRTFMTDRLKNVSIEAVNKINSELALVIVGARTPAEAIGRVAQLVEGGRGRALAILNTELGTAYSTAHQERQSAAANVLPGLKKQWRRSTKRHSRITHDVADGQVVPVDQPFKVGGASIMYPRDPKAPAKERINCGCLSLPYMEHWEVQHPKDKPFSDKELAENPLKRRSQDLQDDAFDSWSKRLLDGKLKAAGNFETAGQLPTAAQTFLARNNVQLAGGDIGVSDRAIVHMRRDAKKDRGAALPASVVRRLPAALANPKAILWDKKAPAPKLVYVVEVPGQKKLAKVVVKLGDVDKRAKHRHHNWVVSGGMVDRSALADAKTYDLITGEI